MIRWGQPSMEEAEGPEGRERMREKGRIKRNSFIGSWAKIISRLRSQERKRSGFWEKVVKVRKSQSPVAVLLVACLMTVMSSETIYIFMKIMLRILMRVCEGGGGGLCREIIFSCSLDDDNHQVGLLLSSLTKHQQVNNWLTHSAAEQWDHYATSFSAISSSLRPALADDTS